MRLKSIHAHAMGSFSDVSINLDSLPASAKLVAIVGENGAGKSTLCDLMTYGAMWREWPRKPRGHLGHVAKARDSLLEVEVEFGAKSYTLRHLVDGVSGKGEAVALDCNGMPLTKSGKLTEYSNWAAENLPPKSVLTSSIISHPAYGSFVAMKAAARKDVILLALGVDGVEAKAKTARERARAEGAKADAFRQRILELSDEPAVELWNKMHPDQLLSGVSLAERVVGEAQYDEHTAGFLVKEAQQALDVARELAGSSALARQRYEEQSKSRRDAMARRDSVHCRLETTLERLELCDVEAALRDAEVAKVKEAAAATALEEAQALAVELRSKREAAKQQQADRQRVATDLAKATESKNSVATRIANNHKILDAAEEIRAVIRRREEAAAELPALEQAEAAAGTVVDVATEALDELSNERHAGADARIRNLRGGLERIARIEVPATAIARDTLAADDATVDAAESLPRRKQEAESARRKAVEARTVATAARLACAKAATERHPHEERLATAEARISELEPQLATARADVERLAAELANLPVPAPIPADPDLIALRRAAERASERARIAGEQLVGTEATRMQLEPTVETLRGELAGLEAQLAATPEPIPPEQGPDIVRLEHELAEVQRQHNAAISVVGAAEARLEAAKALTTKVAELRAELASVELEQSDWARLGADLGRDGLQAALVDSAGPELTTLSNDLLHSTFGSRWTISIETQRIKGDGGTSEECDVRIIDTESGLDGLVEDLSDGERTIVGEAVSLALAILACRRAHFERPTLIRDESGAALSRERRPQWVAMLRRAADIIGADRVLLISHSEDVQELCDARIEVGNGTAKIVGDVLEYRSAA